jgi:hypothetical protein
LILSGADGRRVRPRKRNRRADPGPRGHPLRAGAIPIRACDGSAWTAACSSSARPAKPATEAGALEATATYRVDGQASSGIFAGAKGISNVTVTGIGTASATETISGKLKLAHAAGANVGLYEGVFLMGRVTFSGWLGSVNEGGECLVDVAELPLLAAEEGVAGDAVSVDGVKGGSLAE